MAGMKFKFDANQRFQKEAIDSIVDIFDGQSLRHGEFTAFKHNATLGGQMNELGYGNRLDLHQEDIFKNVIAIQDRNRGLNRSKKIIDEQYEVPNFAIEMETGTGKTYVYTRTMMELNKRYGMTKFIIVVPSLAIREGVYKSLQTTEEHFRELYPGQSFNYFIYNSTRLDQVRTFATSDCIEIMIINIDAFRKGFKDSEGELDLEKTANIIHKPTNRLNDRAPIEFIQKTEPIVIIDEPQSVDNTDKAKEAIKSLNPLFIIRYSATHKDTYNLMYRLGPVEAHDQKLVKTIEVLSVQDEASDRDHLRLVNVMERSGTRKAKIEINWLTDQGRVTKKKVSVKTGDDIYDHSGNNPVYNSHVISSISTEKGNEYLELEDGSTTHLDQVNTDDDDIKRAQIHNTIKAHLEKEQILFSKGIKVISLFFIDRVSHYREYFEEDGDWVSKKGKYAKMFEEEYSKLIKLDKYRTLFNTEKIDSYVLNSDPEKVHNGYFSQDKKGVLKDTKGNTVADEDTYSLIMKNKEVLLSMENSLRFIFSHSALREGWDNPNVFQVCTLVETRDDMTKRQKVGRGLRLPVSQEGDRVMDSQYNILTVVANESYEQFAETLQREMEKETNTKFGVIDERLFENIIQNDEEIGYEKAEEIVNYFKDNNLIDRNGKANKELKNMVALGELELPEEYSDIVKDVEERIRLRVRRLPIFDANDRVSVEINKEVYLSEDFKELWDKIKYKTVYRLNFSPEELKKEATAMVKNMRPVKANAIIAKYVRLRVESEGVGYDDPNRVHFFEREYYKKDALPNILLYVEQYTGLKRKTIADILINSGRLDEFYKNPQVFMEQVVETINSAKRKFILDGIEYEKIGDDVYWSQSMFESKEIIGYLKENSVEIQKSVYSHVVYDSPTIEKPFAERLNADDDVKLFLKLPNWFKVDTPLGSYNPDWAVLLEKNGVEKLYFVIETKGSIDSENLREIERDKIACGKKHFSAISKDLKFNIASNYDFWKNEL